MVQLLVLSGDNPWLSRILYFYAEKGQFEQSKLCGKIKIVQAEQLIKVS